MKTTRMAIALAALATSASCAVAQNDDASPFAAAQDVHATAHADHKKEMERAVAASHRGMQLAQAHAGGSATAPKAMTFTGVRKGSAGRALIIPKDATDVKGLAEVEEDMNVMAHILDKAVSEDGKSGRAMGIPVYSRFGWGGTPPQNLFIEGSGALFFLNVNYPLLPAPDKDPSTETKEKPASEWDTAKKEMAGSPRSSIGDSFYTFGESLERVMVWDNNSSAPYDADKVENLKSDLIAALKNASHIRKLRADETVTVVVTGAIALGAEGAKTARSKDAAVAERYKPKSDAVEPELSIPAAKAPAKLVLRVKKSDTDAFQNGKLNLDDFKKKVTVMNY